MKSGCRNLGNTKVIEIKVHQKTGTNAHCSDQCSHPKKPCHTVVRHVTERSNNWQDPGRTNKHQRNWFGPSKRALGLEHFIQRVGIRMGPQKVRRSPVLEEILLRMRECEHANNGEKNQ